MEWFIIKNNKDGLYGHPLLSTYKTMIEYDYYSDDSGPEFYRLMIYDPLCEQ